MNDFCKVYTVCTSQFRNGPRRSVAQGDISVNVNISDFGMATLQLRAISTAFTNNINNSERRMALELHSEGSPLHRLPSPPPIDLNWAPVRQWEAWEWEDQLGSDPSGFVSPGSHFENHPCCAATKHREATCKLLYIDLYIYFAHFLAKGEIARRIGSFCVWVAVRREAAGSLRIFPWQQYEDPSPFGLRTARIKTYMESNHAGKLSR